MVYKSFPVRQLLIDEKESRRAHRKAARTCPMGRNKNGRRDVKLAFFFYFLEPRQEKVVKDDEDYTLARGLQGNLQSETRTESLLLAHGIITTWISHPLYAAHCRFNRRGGASSFSLTSFRGRRPCSIAVSYIESIQTESANSSLSEFNFGEQRPENK